MPGWESSRRREELPLGWSRRRSQVLRDCDHVCEFPGCDAQATEVDHIRPGMDHSRRNLQGLCRFHHQQKSSFEGNAAQKRRRDARRRPSGRHPGSNAG
jgi:hypothetical protein